MTVTIADTGLGIAEDDLPHIFDPYFRAESAQEADVPERGSAWASPATS